MTFSTKAKGIGKKSALVSASVMAIAMPFTAHHEGVRLKAYLDPVGIPTICYGETLNVSLGDQKTKAECDAMFEYRLGFFGYGVDTMISEPMAPETHAAFTSFAYNIGLGGFRKSKARQYYNAGDYTKGCAAMMGWYRAGGKDCRIRSNNCYGLITRRESEIELCKAGVKNYD